ncbi:hypothetical protein E2C01_093485 [Portunus trituberculatus]|uniref:Uncharacterized protein n=1 Tax=Portunus trituberculatus TaxID=210409 RepID=A0A5B7JPX6_PORTR|nr:hypothetical protein [Portunus trituberculatus]
MHQALATFEAMDPNFEKFTKVTKGIMDLMQCYKEILDEKRLLSVQTNLEQYFKKVERPATDPVPSTSAASITSDSPAPESPAPSECSAASSLPVLLGTGILVTVVVLIPGPFLTLRGRGRGGSTSERAK